MAIVFIVLLFLLFLHSPLGSQVERDLLSEYIENVEILPADIVKHLPQDINAQISYYVQYFTTEKRDVIQRWFKRCEPYLPYFRAIFREEGLPEDLIYLAIVESGCNPFAVSPAGAVGIWQFMEATARQYGLRIDYWIDERRDFIKATYASARYLKRLYQFFGDWRLAVASYNAGEGRVSRALRAKNLADYWKLMLSGAIPFETFAYVPQWLAITIIVKNPEKYGFTPIIETPWDFIEVEVPGGIDLRALTLCAETDLETMRKLNAELRRELTPPNGTYILKIPFSSKGVFYKNLSQIKLKEVTLQTPEGKVTVYLLEDQELSSTNKDKSTSVVTSNRNTNTNQKSDSKRQTRKKSSRQ